jgi:hypothetical protein
VAIDLLGQVDGPIPAVGKNVRFRTFSHPTLAQVASALLLLMLVLFPEISAGQDLSDPPPNRPKKESPPFFSDITIWSAKTVGSVNVMSTYPGQQTFATGIGLRRHMFNFQHTIMRWNFEIIPLCMPSFPTANGQTYHYGGGGALGLDLEPRKQWRVAQPFIDVNFGLLGFTTETPVDTRRTNFSLQFGPGLKFPLRGSSSLKTGVTFFHFSNMHTVKNNPGFDGILIYVGYSFSFEHKRSGPN